MKIVNLFLLGFLIVGCAGSKVLPRFDQLHYNQFGAQIKINDGKGNSLKGELIAANDSGVWVLRNFHQDDAMTVSILPKVNNPIQTIDSFNFYFFPMGKIKAYTVKYARSRKYAAMMGVSVISFGHGIISYLTFPINVFITGAVAIAGSRAYQYTEENLPKSELKKFARYPQGLPSNLDVRQLGNAVFQTPLISHQRNHRKGNGDFAPSKRLKRGSLE